MTSMEPKIRAIMKATGLTQQQIAEKFDVSQSTVNRWLRGSEPEGHRRDAINTAYEGIVADDPKPPTGMTVGVYGYVGAGAEVVPFNDTQYEPFEEVEVDFPVPDGTAALIVRGDSQMPVFEDGDLVGFHKEGQDPDTLIGRMCIVRLADGRMLIKRIKKGSAPRLHTLTSSNASDIDDVVIVWAASFRFRIPWHEWRRM